MKTRCVPVGIAAHTLLSFMKQQDELNDYQSMLLAELLQEQPTVTAAERHFLHAVGKYILDYPKELKEKS